MILLNYTGDNLRIAETNGRLMVKIGRIHGFCERVVWMIGNAEDAAAANRVIEDALMDIAATVGEVHAKEVRRDAR